MIVFSRTDKGKVRASNQDTLIQPVGELALYGVADGMGGHNAGDVASRTAAANIIDFLTGETPSVSSLRLAIQRVNAKLFEMQKNDPSLRGMGTTLTVAWFQKQTLYLGHVGDSRAYLLRNGDIVQVSKDHTLVQEYVDHGLITPEEAQEHPWRNIITRAVGTDAQVDVDVACYPCQSGDRWLFCSDGLYEYIPCEEMLSEIEGDCSQNTVDRLVDLALERGGGDNISLLLAEVTDD